MCKLKVLLILVCLRVFSCTSNFSGAICASELKDFEIICSGEQIGRKFLAESTKFINKKVVFGQLAKPGQFPFFGYSVIYLKTGKKSLCGSSLISSTFVITAAHCLQNVAAAQYFLGSTDNTNFPVMRNGLQFVNHPSYNTPPFANDIALFSLQFPVENTATISTIKLPTRSSVSRSFEGVVMVATGFGLNENGKLPRNLAFTQVTGLSEKQCINELGKTYQSTMICGRGVGLSSICGGKMSEYIHMSVYTCICISIDVFSR